MPITPNSHSNSAQLPANLSAASGWKRKTRIGGVALFSATTRANDRMAKKAAAQAMNEKLSGAGVKPKGLFASEGKIIRGIARQLPKAVAFATVGAGIAAAAFTHAMWLPQAAHFLLHTTPGLITLGVLAAVGIGLAGFYVARKTKLNVSEFMKRHGGQTAPADKADEVKVSTPAKDPTPVKASQTPQNTAQVLEQKVVEKPTAPPQPRSPTSTDVGHNLKMSSSGNLVAANGEQLHEAYSDAESSMPSRAPSLTLSELTKELGKARFTGLSAVD